ncbi:MAG TPA: hypothetical protein VFC90_00355 [Planctomycetota bacterium]|nr:hypothetical protein [Planctomycetota bacterium]
MTRLFLLAAIAFLQGSDDLSRRRDALSNRIEELRGEKIGTPVDIEIGSRKEGGTLALVQSRDLHGGDLGGFERVLKALGLISPALRLELVIPSMAAASMKSYAAGGTLRILDPAIPDDELVYRLTLVLSERRIRDAPPALATFDARMARLAVRHGDADMTKQLFWAGLRVNGARADADHVKKLAEGAEKWERETSGFASLVAPRFLVRSSDFMWRRGGIFMESMRQQGGAARLRYVYKRPPDSTEQILHPEKYIAGERPSELDLRPLELLVAGRGGAAVFRTTLGELGTALLLESIDAKTRPEASRGWSGDVLRAWSEGDRLLIAWATAWDTERDAREFEDAAAAAAFVINGRDEPARAFVVRRGRSAAFIMNCPEAIKAAVIEALWKGSRTDGDKTEPFGKE